MSDNEDIFHMHALYTLKKAQRKTIGSSRDLSFGEAADMVFQAVDILSQHPDCKDQFKRYIDFLNGYEDESKTFQGYIPRTPAEAVVSYQAVIKSMYDEEANPDRHAYTKAALSSLVKSEDNYKLLTRSNFKEPSVFQVLKNNISIMTDKTPYKISSQMKSDQLAAEKRAKKLKIL